jgi:hypothetical protein
MTLKSNKSRTLVRNITIEGYTIIVTDLYDYRNKLISASINVIDQSGKRIPELHMNCAASERVPFITEIKEEIKRRKKAKRRS